MFHHRGGRFLLSRGENYQSGRTEKVSRAEKIGLGGTVFGIGVTILFGVLSPDMNAALQWSMVGIGLVFMVGGAAIAIRGWRTRGSLKTALVRERDSGRRLLFGLGILGRGPLHPRVTLADVEAWEAKVRLLLEGRPDMLQTFLDNPPKSAVSQVIMAGQDALLGGPLAKRVQRRLAQLNKIIDGL